MTTPPQTVAPGDLVEQWGPVAKLLGCSERTAKEWHRRLGLPMFRRVTGKRWTTRSALRTWAQHVGHPVTW